MNPSDVEQCRVFVKLPPGKGPEREYLWAYRISEDDLKIYNFPFFTETVSYGDVVRVSDTGEVLEVLESVNVTRRAIYEEAGDRVEQRRQRQAIWEHMNPQGIECQSRFPGALSMAVPRTLSEDRFLNVIEQCPIPLRLVVAADDSMTGARLQPEAVARNWLTPTYCPECGVKPGELHQDFCGLAVCAGCGQGLTGVCLHGCRMSGSSRPPWSGTWPGAKECSEFGWFSGEGPDLNRLRDDALWDRELLRYVLPGQADPTDVLIAQNCLLEVCPPDIDGREPFTERGWSLLLELAVQNGWQPAGAQGHWHHELVQQYLENEAEDEAEDDAGQEPTESPVVAPRLISNSTEGKFRSEDPVLRTYFRDSKVSAADALALAEALERALPNLPDDNALGDAVITHPEAPAEAILPLDAKVSPSQWFSGPRKQRLKEIIPLLREGEFVIW
jgi:hypothetical protein